MTASNDFTPPPVRSTAARLKKIVSWLLPLVILLLAILLAWWLTQSGPKVGKRAPVRNAVLVETLPVAITTERIILTANGTVQAARQVELRPRVSGTVTAISAHLLPGGKVQQGATLLTLDASDYQLALTQQENNVIRATAELQLEKGNQLLAQKEYELLGSAVSEAEIELMLRQPQLHSLQAALDSAQAAREQARLNLERTRVTAPFNGIIASRQVNVGSQVTSATPLATLIDSDHCWIEATLPVAQLQWIDIPPNATQTGSTVHITSPAWGEQVERRGHVLRLLPELEEQGRLARLLIEVNDPLALTADNANQPPLLLGSWVTLTIDGRELPAVAALDRAWLRDGNTVWLRDPAGKLEIRPLQPVFRGRDQVLIETGLAAGEELVTSRLSAPVAGMALRTADEAARQPAPTGEEQAAGDQRR
ncbi:MAG: efflux RND transporter periplasmic adaptor subunit [Desulfuromonadales bacterium]|nr:efflux RND transporter periplasmic adaptor subunit [Desulfuromonadales bacterium]